jgi:multidrug efflux pump subunit AcrA (membrane-fusion protein)
MTVVRTTRTRWLPAAAIVALTALASACGQDNRYVAPPPPQVSVALPVQQEVTRYLEATGNTAAVNSANLVARVQGFLAEIHYRDGDDVKQGATLFTIEPEPYKLRLEQARAGGSQEGAGRSRAAK